MIHGASLNAVVQGREQSNCKSGWEHDSYQDLLLKKLVPNLILQHVSPGMLMPQSLVGFHQR